MLKKYTVFGLLAVAMMAGTAQAEDASGLTFDAVLTTDILSNTQGGVQTGTRAINNLDLSVAWQGENGWEAFGYVIADNGGGFGDLTGDTHGVSNIDAPENVRLLELWGRKTFGDGAHAISVGAINLNTVFDVNDAGGVFINPAHGIGTDYAQSGPSLFPLTSLGAMYEYRPSETQKFSFGVFNATLGKPGDDNSLAGFSWHLNEGVHWVVEYQTQVGDTTLKLGHWAFSDKADRLDGMGQARNSGTYVSVTQPLSEKATGFVRFGVANDEVNPMGQYFGFGISYQGLIASRDNDVAGFAIAHGRFGKIYRDQMGSTADAETNFEATYQFEVKPGLIIQPDVQYIHNPSADPSLKDALVVGVRLRVGLDAFR